MGKKPLSLSWDAFQSMGNPENAPEMPKEEKKSNWIQLKESESFLIVKEGER